MCGITGICHFDGEAAARPLLQKMTDVIAHRGPDGEGIYLNQNIGLGHRRLAIIDLTETGAQPMHSSDGRYTLVYNGQIYNFRELRQELEAKGYVFKSTSDTEVLLYGLIHWGKDVLPKLNGMFAFAFYDKQEHLLTLARDRYGIKPLYYYNNQKTLLFGSEIKSILQHPDYKKEIDYSAVYEYFSFQNLFSDKTLLKDIHILPPGTVMTFHTKRSSPVAFEQYWDFHFEEDFSLNEDECIEKLDELFKQSVKRHLVSDVDVGSYLSGGMDSGAITTIASQQFPNLRTFTCGFDLNSNEGSELSYDERKSAELLSYTCKTEHYEVVIKSKDMERSLAGLTYHLEDLRVGQSYPNFYAAKLASKFNKVVLSGAAGDELFAGYPWRYKTFEGATTFDTFIDKYHAYWLRLLPKTELTSLFAPIAPHIAQVDTREIFKSVFPPALRVDNPSHYINHALYFEAKTFLHGLLLVDDKLSMAHSLESRTPFLDNDLVSFAMKVPVKYKLRNFDKSQPLSEKYLETNNNKVLLRNTLSKYLPDEIVKRKKQGFAAPDSSWFRKDCADFIHSRLFSTSSPIHDMMDTKKLKSVVESHNSGEDDNRKLMWSLLNFEQWTREFL